MELCILILSSIVYFGTAHWCADEEDCLASIGLLQFQVNVSTLHEVERNSTIEEMRSNRTKPQGNISASQQDSINVFANLTHSDSPKEARHQGQNKQIPRRRLKPGMYWNTLLLLMGMMSLIWHLRPMIANMRDMYTKYRQHAIFETDSTETLVMPRSRTQVVFYGASFIVASCAHIKYNQYLMTEGRFPFAVNLAIAHQVSGFVIVFVLYRIRPWLYPSLVGISLRTVMWELLPILFCFSAQLVLNNVALTYASVAFLQMMKQTNIVLVYLMSVIVGIQQFDGVLARVLLCLLLSAALSIRGQVNFSMTGFLLQGSSQFMESIKIVVQSMLLSAAGFVHLDPYSYNLLVMPTTAFILCCFLCVCVAWVRIPFIDTASWADYVAWGPHILANCVLAITFNIVTSIFVTHSSAVGYAIACIMKDVFLVVVDVLIWGSKVSQLQVVSFGLQVTFTCVYSFLKTSQGKVVVEKSKAPLK